MNCCKKYGIIIWGDVVISYEYYKVFYYCGKFLNFTKAAGALNTSQSSVSHTINTLEYQLGCRLFVRSNRGISFTSEGERLFSYVSEGCGYFIKGENELISGFSADSGTVYLSMTETALHCYLFDVLNKFKKQYPDIKFIIENSSSYNAVDHVNSGRSDYAILSAPADIPTEAGEKVLFEFRDVLIGGYDFRRLAEKKISLKQLSDHPFVSLCEGTATRDFFDRVFERSGIIIRPDIEVATTDMILPMVSYNMGLGFVPEPMVKADSGISIIQTVEDIPSRSINIVYRKNTVKSPAAVTFFNFCVSES